MTMINRLVFVVLLLIVFGFTIGTAFDINQIVSIDDWEKPRVKYPDDNPFSEASIKLGGELFFE